jgi:hypothetical protein
MCRQGIARIGTTLAFLAIAAAVSAAPDVVAIKDGTFIYDAQHPGLLDISGTSAFTLMAHALTGTFNAVDQCNFTPECQPGDVVEIRAQWLGNDLPGTAQLRGKTYEDLGGLNSPNSVAIQFSGQVTMPAMSDGPTTVTVPFDFTGLFKYEVPDGVGTAVLIGGGLVTFALEPSLENSWRISSAVFEFRRVKR